MSKTEEFLMFHVIKRYINDKIKMRSGDNAVRHLMERVNAETKDVIEKAAGLAGKARRKTIQLEDMQQAAEENLGRVELTPRELLEEIKKQKPTDLGFISDGLRKYIRAQRQK